MTRLKMVAFMAVLASCVGGEGRVFGQEVKAVRLKYSQAADLLASLNSLVSGKEVVLAADSLSNTVVVSAPKEKIGQVVSLIAALDAPSNNKQYVIAMCVCRGDPLGAKNSLEVLTRPVLLTIEGQTGVVAVRTMLKGLDSDTDEFVGISIHCRPISEKEGTIRLEIGCRIAEVVEETTDGHEIRVLSARQNREVRVGENFKMRLKGASATNQTWLEATVTEVRQITRDK